MVQNIQKKILTKNKVILLNSFFGPFYGSYILFELDQVKVCRTSISQRIYGFNESIRRRNEESEEESEEVETTE